MYEAFFGLQERPFDLTPDPRFLFMTAGHREALATIQYAISGRKGITLLIGPAGTGKTTLVQAALQDAGGSERQGASTWPIPTLTRKEFFQFLALELNLTEAAAPARRPISCGSWTRRCGSGTPQGFVTALVVDEAQALSDTLLEEVRLLANSETSTEKLFPVVLIGQPELAARLNERPLQQLKQRVALRALLAPLNLRETADYIAERIRIAGGDIRTVFAPEAVAAIFGCSGGIPQDDQRGLRQRAGVGLRARPAAGRTVGDCGGLPRLRSARTDRRRHTARPPARTRDAGRRRCRARTACVARRLAHPAPDRRHGMPCSKCKTTLGLRATGACRPEASRPPRAQRPHPAGISIPVRKDGISMSRLEAALHRATTGIRRRACRTRTRQEPEPELDDEPPAGFPNGRWSGTRRAGHTRRRSSTRPSTSETLEFHFEGFNPIARGKADHLRIVAGVLARTVPAAWRHAAPRAGGERDEAADGQQRRAQRRQDADRDQHRLDAERVLSAPRAAHRRRSAASVARPDLSGAVGIRAERGVDVGAGAESRR